MRGSLKRRKNGNWTDEQLSSAMAAFDSGMSMKKSKWAVPHSIHFIPGAHLWNEEIKEKKCERHSYCRGGAATLWLASHYGGQGIWLEPHRIKDEGEWDYYVQGHTLPWRHSRRRLDERMAASPSGADTSSFSSIRDCTGKRLV
jgi:hypothetical protein